MKKAISFLLILIAAMFCSACLNTVAVHKLNTIAAQCIQKGDVSCAVSRLEASVDLDPDNYETRYNLAVAYIKQDECDKAAEQIKAAKAIKAEENALNYLEALSLECSAQKQLYKKDEEGIEQKIEFEDKFKEDSAKQQYIQYLKEANNAYSEYIKALSNTSEIQSIQTQINLNTEAVNQIEQGEE